MMQKNSALQNVNYCVFSGFAIKGQKENKREKNKKQEMRKKKDADRNYTEKISGAVSSK